MAVIPQFFNDCVVAIGKRKSEEEIVWIATGFVVARPNDSGGYNTFLVTNRHVLNNENELVVRFNIAGQLSAKDYDILLKDEKGQLYSTHPNPKVDVACIMINGSVLKEDLGNVSAFPLDQFALTREEMILNDVVEGTLVYSLGFPSGLVGVNTKAPLCRLGCISRISEIINEEGFLLDIQNFPGSSGSPVINRIESNHLKGSANFNSTRLIGIMAAYIPYRDVLVSRQTGEAMQVTMENSGIAIAYSVNAIKTTVEIEFDRNLEIEKNSKGNEENPIVDDSQKD